MNYEIVREVPARRKMGKYASELEEIEREFAKNPASILKMPRNKSMEAAIRSRNNGITVSVRGEDAYLQKNGRGFGTHG